MAFNTQVKKICKVCEKEFSVVKSRMDKAVTCSRECRGKIDAERYSASRIKRNCLSCGKEIEVTERRAALGAGKYCSYDCHNLAMSLQEHKTWADGNEVPHSAGYVLVRDNQHPYTVGGYVFKHRLVMENKMRNEVPNHNFLIDIGGIKFLKREIQVHHFDEEKLNNVEGNLLACTAGAHRDFHNNLPVMIGEFYPEYEWIKTRDFRGIKCNCNNCGKEFFSSRSAIKDGRGKNCSVECQAAQHSKNKSVDVVCQCCSKTFKAWKSAVELGRMKFCSNECRFKARKGHSSSHVFPPPVIKP